MQISKPTRNRVKIVFFRYSVVNNRWDVTFAPANYHCIIVLALYRFDAISKMFWSFLFQLHTIILNVPVVHRYPLTETFQGVRESLVDITLKITIFVHTVFFSFLFKR